MRWLTTVLAVLKVVERVIPVVEGLFPAGSGVTKAAVVAGSAEAAVSALLPGVSMQDPQMQALLQAKIAADVALANALQRAASATAPAGGSPGTP